MWLCCEIWVGEFVMMNWCWWYLVVFKIMEIVDKNICDWVVKYWIKKCDDKLYW